MEPIDHNIRSIFELQSLIDTLFFKSFIQHYTMPLGLNQTHLKALINIRFNDGCPMSDISHRLGMEKGSFTPVANKLIANDFIRKTRSQTDKRVYNLELTEKGKETADSFGRKHWDYIENLLTLQYDDEAKNEFLTNVASINKQVKLLAESTNQTLPNIPPDDPRKGQLK